MSAPPAQFVRTRDGYDIAYFAAGEGPTLVKDASMWNHNSRQWRPEFLGPVYDAFASQFRFICYDGRGQGLSSRGLPDSLTLDELALDLEAVIDEVGAEPVVLFGNFVTASVPIRYAAMHPERVRALVLNNYQDYQSRSEATLRLAEEDWEFHIQTTVRSGQRDMDVDLAIEIARDSTTQADHIRRMKALRSVAGADLLARVTVPTLIIEGPRASEGIVPGHYARRWAAMLPGSQMVTLEGPGVYGALKDGLPEVGWAIMQFLTSQLPQTSAELAVGAEEVSLSPRETEVLHLLAAGKTNTQIAADLVISPSTVGKHVMSIYRKTDTANRAQVTAFAYRHHLI